MLTGRDIYKFPWPLAFIYIILYYPWINTLSFYLLSSFVISVPVNLTTSLKLSSGLSPHSPLHHHFQQTLRCTPEWRECSCYFSSYRISILEGPALPLLWSKTISPCMLWSVVRRTVWRNWQVISCQGQNLTISNWENWESSHIVNCCCCCCCQMFHLSGGSFCGVRGVFWNCPITHTRYVFEQ